MRKTTPVIAAALAVAATMAAAPAQVSVGYYADHTHIFEVHQTDGAPVEVRMFGGAGEVLIDSEETAGEEPLGCVEIFKNNLLDAACGALVVSPEPLLRQTRVTGALDSTLYRYDPDTVSFEEIGASRIVVSLTLKGTGDIRLAHSERTGLGVCGLPPDTRGVSLLAELPLIRAAEPAGTLRSQELGQVHTGPLTAKIMDSRFVTAGACLEG